MTNKERINLWLQSRINKVRNTFSGVDTNNSISNRFWRGNAGNNLALWQQRIGDPSSRLKLGRDFQLKKNDPTLIKMYKLGGNVTKNAAESILTEVPKVAYDYTNLFKDARAGNPNTNFTSKSARFGEDIMSYLAKDSAGKTIRKPLDTIGLQKGQGKWTLPITNTKLPEFGVTESSAFNTFKKGVGAAESPLSALGMSNPVKMLSLLGFGSALGGGINYAVKKGQKGSFEEGAWDTAYNMAPTLAKSSGLLGATDKLTTVGKLPIKSLANVLQGIAYDQTTNQETTGTSILIDALYPTATAVSSKVFRSLEDAVKNIQGNILQGLGKRLRKSDGTYTTLAKWVKGTRPYQKNGMGMFFGFEMNQDENGGWHVSFSKDKALVGMALVTGTQQGLKGIDNKFLGGDTAKGSDLDDILKAQEVKGGDLMSEARKYKSAEEFINAKFNEPPKYGMSHRPTFEGMPPAHNLLEGDVIPRDVYEHPEWSIAPMRLTDKPSKESFDALLKIRNNPDMEIPVYRASAKNELNNGDWITFSKTYAKDSVEGTEKVFTHKIKAKDAVFAGDDINEFGYYPKSQLTDIWNQANKGGGVGVKSPVDQARSLSPSSRSQSSENGILNTNKVQDTTKIAQDTPKVLPKNLSSSQSSTQIIAQSGAKIKKPTTIADIEKSLYGSETKVTDIGTKTSAGFIGNKLRTVENLISDRVAKGLTSNNKYVRGVSTVLQDLFGGAGKSQGQIMARAEYRGGIDYATKVASDSQKYVYNLLENDTKSLERVHAFLDPSISKIKVTEASLKPNEKEAVAYLRVVSDFINDTNYKNGFISKELWAKNQGGKYIARAYEPFDYPPEVADFIKDKSIGFDLNPFKQRSEVTDWKIENSIKDPAYLMSKRLQQTMFNSEVAKYTTWAKNSGLISDTAKPGFVQLSDSKAYGDVAGKWIRKDALEDVKGFFMTNDIAQKAYDILKWYDRNPVRRFEKSLKTVYNPAVRLGNRTGNYIFAWLNGINPATFAKNKLWANSAIKNNNAMYRRAVQLGLTGTDVTKADITRISSEIKRGVTDKNLLAKVDGVIKESYGRVDDSSKLAAYKTWLDRGFTEKEAVNRAMRGFQDYSMVGMLYDIGARLPILGNPFVRFSAESIRIAKNSAIDHPIRAISTIVAWKMFTDVMSGISGETKEDKKTRESRVGAAHIPFTNIPMSVQTPWGEVNASRLTGFATTYTPEDSMLPDLSKYAPIQDPTDIRSYTNDPVIGPLIATALDKDFRGKSISDPNQNKYTGSLLTPQEKNLNRLGYIGRSYLPPSVTDVSNINAAIQGKPNVYGQVKTPIQAILRTYPGVKVEQFGPEEADAVRQRNADYNAYRLKYIQTQIKAVQKQLNEGKITPEQAENRINSLNREKVTSQSTSGRTFENSPEAPNNVFERIHLAANATVTNPKNALRVVQAIFTEEKMRKLSGDTLIFERETNLNKTEEKGDVRDHIIPLSLGGDNSNSNLRYISAEANQAKAKLETKLARQLANNEITGAEARKQIKAYYTKYEGTETQAPSITTEKPPTTTTQSGISGVYTITNPTTGKDTTIDLSEPLTKPQTTGYTELDKELLTKYKSSITTRINNIEKLYLDGQITASEAEKEIKALKALKTSTAKAKKAKKITFKKLGKSNLKKVKLTPITAKRQKSTLWATPTLKAPQGVDLDALRNPKV